MASEMTDSSAFMMASTLRLPPTAARSLLTAAKVVSSLVCDESMREINVANR